MVGIKISNGAVIAANSFVNKDLPPYAVVGGSPDKIIGYRFEDSIIEKLLQLQWWNWSNEQMLENKLFFEKELTDDILNTFL